MSILLRQVTGKFEGDMVKVEMCEINMGRVHIHIVRFFRPRLEHHHCNVSTLHDKRHSEERSSAFRFRRPRRHGVWPSTTSTPNFQLLHPHYDQQQQFEYVLLLDTHATPATKLDWGVYPITTWSHLNGKPARTEASS